MNKKEKEELKSKIEKDMEDFLMKRLDEGLREVGPKGDIKDLNKRMDNLEERINELDIRVQNLLEKEEPEGLKPEDVRKELMEKMGDLEDEISKMRKKLSKIGFSTPTVIE